MGKKKVMTKKQCNAAFFRLKESKKLTLAKKDIVLDVLATTVAFFSKDK